MTKPEFESDLKLFLAILILGLLIIAGMFAGCDDPRHESRSIKPHCDRTHPCRLAQ